MADAPATALDVLARAPTEPTWQSLPELWEAYTSIRAEGCSPLVSAAHVAARADRLGQAFAVGYPAALERLVPGVGLPCAFCVTEKDGNGPRAIETILEPVEGGYRLSGHKTFVTFGTLAKSLIIVARVGKKSDGRPDLAVVRVPTQRDGIRVEELPPMPFVPEVVHARLVLHGVEVHADERLPGDGYLGYVKPFRTIEDIHVIAATIAYLVGWARRTRVNSNLRAELSADLVALDALASAEPLDPRMHLALHGRYSRVLEALAGDDFASLLAAASGDERLRWERDRVLLDVASKARKARFEAANRALESNQD